MLSKPNIFRVHVAFSTEKILFQKGFPENLPILYAIIPFVFPYNSALHLIVQFQSVFEYTIFNETRETSR